MTRRGDTGCGVFHHDATIGRHPHRRRGPGEPVQTGAIFILGVAVENDLEGVDQFEPLKNRPGIPAGGDRRESNVEPAQSLKQHIDAREAVTRSKPIQHLLKQLVLSIQHRRESLGCDPPIPQQLLQRGLTGDPAKCVGQIEIERQIRLVGKPAPGIGVEARGIGNDAIDVEQEGPYVGLQWPLSPERTGECRETAGIFNGLWRVSFQFPATSI